MNFNSTFGKSQLPKNVFASISAALGGEDDENRQFRFEAKKRGMSDVDDSNIQ